MTRMILTDASWARIEPHCLGKASDPGRTGGDARLFLEAALRIARTGSPRRDPPEGLGTWNAAFRRVRRWAKAAVFKRIFDALSGGPDMEFVLADGAIVKVRRHGQGAKGGLEARLSASPAAAGRPGSARGPMRSAPSRASSRSPGGAATWAGVAPLIEGVAFGGLIADKAFDADRIVAELDARGAQAAICRRPKRVAPRRIDAEIRKWRRLIESFFGKLKEFKRIALRACKTDASFAAIIYAAAAVIAAR